MNGEQEWIEECAVYIGELRTRSGSQETEYQPGSLYDERQNVAALRQLRGEKNTGGLKKRLETVERQTLKLVEWELSHVHSGMDTATLRELRTHVVKALNCACRLAAQCVAEKGRTPTTGDPRRRNLYLHASAYRLAFTYCDSIGNRRKAGKMAEDILQTAGVNYLASNGTVNKWRRELEAEADNRAAKK